MKFNEKMSLELNQFQMVYKILRITPSWSSKVPKVVKITKINVVFILFGEQYLMNAINTSRSRGSTLHVREGWWPKSLLYDYSIAFVMKKNPTRSPLAHRDRGISLWFWWRIFSFFAFMDKGSCSQRRNYAPDISCCISLTFNFKISKWTFEIHSEPHRSKLYMVLGYYRCFWLNRNVGFQK